MPRIFKKRKGFRVVRKWEMEEPRTPEGREEERNQSPQPGTSYDDDDNSI